MASLAATWTASRFSEQHSVRTLCLLSGSIGLACMLLLFPFEALSDENSSHWSATVSMFLLVFGISLGFNIPKSLLSLTTTEQGMQLVQNWTSKYNKNQEIEKQKSTSTSILDKQQQTNLTETVTDVCRTKSSTSVSSASYAGTINGIVGLVAQFTSSCSGSWVSHRLTTIGWKEFINTQVFAAVGFLCLLLLSSWIDNKSESNAKRKME